MPDRTRELPAPTDPADSVRSGQVIPTSGWMPTPLAELTIAEAAPAERRVLDEGNDGVVFGVGRPLLRGARRADITPVEEQAGEEHDDEPAPEPSPGIYVERDDRPR